MSGILQALDEALANSTHLSDVDQATVQTARAMAKTLDEMAATDPAKFVYACPHYRSYLEALLLTPQARKAADLGVEKKVSKVADMKRERERRNVRPA